MKVSVNNELAAVNKSDRELTGSSFLKYMYFAIILVTLAYFCVLPLRNLQIRHIIVFIGTVLFYVLAIYRLIHTRYKINLFLRILIVVGLVIVGLLFSSSDNFLKLIYSSLNFLTLFILMSTDNPITLTKKMMKWTIRIFLLMAVIFLMIANSSVAYLFEDGRSTNALALGMTNPNFTAMMILGVSSVLLMGLKETRYKIALSFVLTGLLYLIWLTGARSSFVALIILLVYNLFFTNKKVTNFLIFIIFICVILSSPAYIYLYNTGWEYSFMGKSFFSGRVSVFYEFLSLLYTRYHILFGNLGEAQFSNAHNAPLAILTNVGLVGLLVIYFSFFLQLIKVNKSAYSSISKLAIVCLLCTYVQSCAEASLFLGVYPGITFMYLYSTLANGILEN